MPRLMGMEVEALCALGLYGHNTYCEQDTWPNWEVGHYLLARLLWGERAETALADYLKMRFGACSGDIDAYLVLLENAVRRLYSGHGRRNFAAVEQLGAGVVRDCRRQLEQALQHLAAATVTPSQPLLQCWRTAVEYALADLDLRLAAAEASAVPEAYARWREVVLSPGMAPGRGVLLAEDYGPGGAALLHLHEEELRPLLAAGRGGDAPSDSG